MSINNSYYNIFAKDYQLKNDWAVDSKGPKFSDNTPQFIIDQSTGRKYLNESRSIIRVKFVFLAMGTPFTHFAAGIFNVIYRILKLVTLSHFWIPEKKENNSFKKRAAHAGVDLFRIISSPLFLLGLEGAALYGLFRPYDGRKLYATLERSFYGNFILAPCFQPEPEKHLLGGDINIKNAF